jgi:hypothetical protein
MGLGLGTRIGEYKDPETRMPVTRRARSAASSLWGGHCVNLDNSSYTSTSYRDIDEDEVEMAKMSVQLCFKATDIAQHDPLFSYRRGNTIHGVYLKGSKVRVFTTEDYASTITGLSSNNTLSSDTWYHVVAKFDVSPATDTVNLRINGTQQTGAADDDPIWASTDKRLRFGYSTRDTDGNTSRLFGGRMNQMALWKGKIGHKLTDALYMNGRIRSALNGAKASGTLLEHMQEKELYGYWPIIKDDFTNTWPSTDDELVLNMMRYKTTLGIWGGGVLMNKTMTPEHKNSRSLETPSRSNDDVVNDYMGA